MSKLYNLLFLVATLAPALPLKAAGEDPMIEKRKSYSKSYPVTGSDRITLENKFGELVIQHWNRNEVQVDVTIRAEAGTDERASRILESISVQDGKSSSGVFFRTKIGSNNNQKWSKGEKEGFNIDYVVHLPSQNPLIATNEFGNMTIGDHSGETSLVCKFGTLTAGRLTNVKKVLVEFGKATIAAVNNGDLTVKFSRAQVNNLDGSIDASFEHCSGIKLGVTNNINDLRINNSFTSLFLDLSHDLSANFDISTSFAEVKNQSQFTIKKEGEDEERRGPKFDFKYYGKAGSGSREMKIKTSFGNITLGHNLPFNPDDDKKKEKKQTRDI